MNREHRFFVLFLIVLALLILPDATTAATPEQVDQALTKGKAFLYSKSKNGNWENLPVAKVVAGDETVNAGQWGGLTALASYALLAAGDRPAGHPELASAIEFLKGAELKGTYAIGVRAQVWNFLPPSADVHRAVSRDGELLLKAISTKGDTRGFYSYGITPNYHHSPSQYGVLGMWACNQAGLEISTKYWSLIDESWRRTQQADGGWSYTLKPDVNNPVKASMTAADAKIPATRTIHVARLKYPGNWNPEPGGWRRLSAVTHNQAHVDLDVTTISLGDGELIKRLGPTTTTSAPATTQPGNEGVKIAHLTAPPSLICHSPKRWS